MLDVGVASAGLMWLRIEASGWLSHGNQTSGSIKLFDWWLLKKASSPWK
jgi:hypothetical protein